MKYIKNFESVWSHQDIPLKYKEVIRKCLDLIKSNIDKLDEISKMILTLVATNKTLYFKYGKNIILDDKYLKENFAFVLNNIKDIFEIVFKTYVNGLIGELIVKNLLETEFGFKVSAPTQKGNVDGSDLITIKNGRILNHQVKFKYQYDETDDELVFNIRNRFLDIKKTDIYDYLWFFVDNKNEVVLFKKEDITVEKNRTGYSIYYTKIKKYDIDSDTVEHFKEEANSVKLKFDENIDYNYEKLNMLLLTQNYNL